MNNYTVGLMQAEAALGQAAAANKQAQVAHNRQQEDARHNAAVETETTRHNQMAEFETSRSNIARETETYRHNMVSEDLETWRNINDSANAVGDIASIFVPKKPGKK